MSEAVAELPEAPPAPQKDADELISQMAGKEVDRLLASADIEREVEPATGAQVEGARAISSPVGPLAEEEDQASSEDDALLAKQIEALIAQDKEKPPAIAEQAAASAAEAVTTPVGAESHTASSVAETAIAAQSPAPTELPALQQETSAGGSSAETAQTSAAAEVSPKPADAAAAAKSHSESIEVDVLAIASDEERRLPTFLLPLDWLNRPFDFLTSAARDVLGKIAVVTSLNAAALFAYVIWFRHR